MDKDRELKMELPEGFAQALSRRHYGANHILEEIKECKIKLDKLYHKYNKNKGKLKLIDEYWDTMNIESHFKEPIWYNAHKRRGRYIKNMEDCHRQMFYILTNFDGNGREEFSKYDCINVDDIIDDFQKYLKRNKL